MQKKHLKVWYAGIRFKPKMVGLFELKNEKVNTISTIMMKMESPFLSEKRGIIKKLDAKRGSVQFSA